MYEEMLAVIIKELADGKFHSKDELEHLLEDAGLLDGSKTRLNNFIQWARDEGTLVRIKQGTYAIFGPDENEQFRCLFTILQLFLEGDEKKLSNAERKRRQAVLEKCKQFIR